MPRTSAAGGFTSPNQKDFGHFKKTNFNTISTHNNVTKKPKRTK